LVGFTDVLGRHLKSTAFLEGYWRRRDTVPAADAWNLIRLPRGPSIVAVMVLSVSSFN